MRPLRFVLWFGLILSAGCGTEREAPQSASEPLPPAPEMADAPTSLRPGKLALLGPNGEIHVGDGQDAAEKAFPAPPNAFAVRDAPQQFPPPYKARGFETVRESVAFLLYGDRIALALRTNQDVTDSVVDQVVRQYRDKFGKTSAAFDGAEVEYWFWFQEGHRLMICKVKDATKPGRYDLTQVVGDSQVMNALRMNPSSAGDDQKLGMNLLRKAPVKKG